VEARSCLGARNAWGLRGVGIACVSVRAVQSEQLPTYLTKCCLDNACVFGAGVHAFSWGPDAGAWHIFFTSRDLSVPDDLVEKLWSACCRWEPSKCPAMMGACA